MAVFTPQKRRMPAKGPAVDAIVPAAGATKVETEVTWRFSWEGSAGGPGVGSQTQETVRYGAASLDIPPSLGTQPVPLQVRLKSERGGGETLEAKLRDLYLSVKFCDTVLVCNGRQFPCHRCVLVARSPTFKESLEGSVTFPGESQEVRLLEITNPEAARVMLDFLYGVDPETRSYGAALKNLDINKDVLRLARRFQLPGLEHQASQWLTQDLTTGNVVERLAVCDEFELGELRARIIQQLTLNHRALQEIAGSAKIIQYPALMQAILQQSAAAAATEAKKPEAASGPRAKKRARNGSN